ncbi:hypothetical protein PG984_011216 [Apiospora sp. TS-2023a]
MRAGRRVHPMPEVNPWEGCLVVEEFSSTHRQPTRYSMSNEQNSRVSSDTPSQTITSTRHNQFDSTNKNSNMAKCAVCKKLCREGAHGPPTIVQRRECGINPARRERPSFTEERNPPKNPERPRCLSWK